MTQIRQEQGISEIKHNQSVETQSHKKDKTKTRSVVRTRVTNSWDNPIKLSGNGAFEDQATLLNDPRLPTSQRQALVAEIGRMQGNRHLPRAV